MQRTRTGIQQEHWKMPFQDIGADLGVSLKLLTASLDFFSYPKWEWEPGTQRTRLSHSPGLGEKFSATSEEEL